MSFYVGCFYLCATVGQQSLIAISMSICHDSNKIYVYIYIYLKKKGGFPPQNVTFGLGSVCYIHCTLIFKKKKLLRHAVVCFDTIQLTETIIFEQTKTKGKTAGEN